jgi:tetratricopeptide (TPR) repeat protein
MALVSLWYEWNWAGAETEFQRAIELKPNYAAAHNWYAPYLNVMQRFSEAAAQQRVAEELDPLSLIIAMNAGDPSYFARQYLLAIEHLQRVVKREPNFPWAYFNLGRVYAQSGRYEEAITAFETATRLWGIRLADAGVAYASARAGNTKRARDIRGAMEELATTGYVPSPQLAMISLGMGDFEKAVEQLERGYEERSFLDALSQFRPCLRWYSHAPRFHRSPQAHGFPTALGLKSWIKDKKEAQPGSRAPGGERPLTRYFLRSVRILPCSGGRECWSTLKV